MIEPLNTSTRQTGVDWAALACQATSLGVRLYATHGVPQLFARVGDGRGEQFEDSWLYVPRLHLNTMRRSVEPFESEIDVSTAVGNPVESEQYQLIPLLTDHRVAAILTVNAGQDVPAQELQKLCAGLAVKYNANAVFRTEIASEFVSRLFHRDNSVDSFVRRTLAWMSHIWTNSYAGVYVEAQGVYVQRLTVGSLERCHRLAREIPFEVAAPWENDIGLANRLIPAEILPDHPMFLTAPPDFLFMHPGVVCEPQKQLLVIAGPGNLLDASVCRLGEILRLLSRLHVSQFTTCAEMTRHFGRLGTSAATERQFNEDLKELFDVLSQQIALTRVAIDLGVDSTRERYREIVIQPGRPASVGVAEGVAIPSQAVETLAAGRPFVVKEIGLSDLDQKTAKELYVRNVRAEMYLPLGDAGVESGMVVFGSPVQGDYLSSMLPFLQCVADYIRLHGKLLNAVTRGEIPSSTRTTGPQIEPLLRRLETVQKLSLATLHGLNSAISVADGQLELLSQSGKDISTGDHELRTARMRDAMDAVWKHVEGIGQICACAEPTNMTIGDASAFIRLLPLLFEGTIRQIRDTKNISVSVHSDEVPDEAIAIGSAAIYDFLLPLVTSVLGSAVCSGTVGVSMRSEDDQCRLTILFDRALIGDISLTEFGAGVLHGYEPAPNSNGQDGYVSGLATCYVHVVDDDTYELCIDCGAPRHSSTPTPMTTARGIV
ncbi:MAG: hypothetical protein AB1644_01840 [Candidatus Zixiibacteriota bacterium]